jgi:hypothetical protein
VRTAATAATAYEFDVDIHVVRHPNGNGLSKYLLP